MFPVQINQGGPQSTITEGSYGGTLQLQPIVIYSSSFRKVFLLGYTLMRVQVNNMKPHHKKHGTVRRKIERV